MGEFLWGECGKLSRGKMKMRSKRNIMRGGRGVGGKG